MCCCLTFGTKSGHFGPSFHFQGPNDFIWDYFGPHFNHKKTCNTQSEPTRCGNASRSFSSLAAVLICSSRQTSSAPSATCRRRSTRRRLRWQTDLFSLVSGGRGQHWLQLNMKANNTKLSAEKNELVVVGGLAVQVIEQFHVSFWNAAPPLDDA